jgi:uncharacterized protein
MEPTESPVKARRASGFSRLPFRGTLLNTLTVVTGATIGLMVGRLLPTGLQTVAMSGIGLVTTGIAVKMFLETKNVLVVAASVVVGGIIGKVVGIDLALGAAAEWTRSLTGSSSSGFNDGLITATVLFCVGPVTLMGCLQDGLERKTELLGLKSLLDGVSSVFLAAASFSFGQGVLASAAFVLVIQGSLTAIARPIQSVAKNPNLVAEATAAGGSMMLAIGLGLLNVPVVKDIPKEVFLPALVIAPVLAALFERREARNSVKTPEDPS